MDGNNRFDTHTETVTTNTMTITIPGVPGNRIVIKSTAAFNLAGTGAALLTINDGRLIYQAEEAAVATNPGVDPGPNTVDIAAQEGAEVVVKFSAATLTVCIFHVTHALYGV